MAWEIDAVHSRVRFSVHQMAARPVRGRFDAIRGYLYVDHENPMHSWVDAEVDAASIDTGSAERDAHLRSVAFLDAAGYPSLTFKSNRVEHGARQAYTVRGDLTMRGVTQLVSFDAGFDEHSGMNEARRAALTARMQLNCAEFGCTLGTAAEASPLPPGDLGEIEIDLTLVSRLPVHPLSVHQRRIAIEQR